MDCEESLAHEKEGAGTVCSHNFDSQIFELRVSDPIIMV